MTRLMIMLLFVVAAGLADVQPAQAVSRYNPYRSFNLSGYNYGSTQWEAKHVRRSNGSWSNGRSSGRFFRGR